MPEPCVGHSPPQNELLSIGIDARDQLFMSDETPNVTIPLRRMTQAELDAFLEKAADILDAGRDKCGQHPI